MHQRSRDEDDRPRTEADAGRRRTKSIPRTLSWTMLVDSLEEIMANRPLGGFGFFLQSMDFILVV